MKRLVFYFDPGCADCARSFAELPEALAGLSWCVDYRPIPPLPDAPQAHGDPARRTRLARLAWACGPNRRVADAVILYASSASATDDTEGAALAARLAPGGEPDGPAATAALQVAMAAAAADGVRELPALCSDGRVFSGPEAVRRLRDSLA